MENFESKTFNGWEYSLHREGDLLPIIKPGRNPTKTLFKYYNLNEHNIKAFIDSYFYASQPDDFNDLFDSNQHSIFLSNIKNEEIIRFLHDCKKNHPEKDWVKAWKNNPGQIYWKMIINYWIGTFGATGLLSLSGTDHDERLWAHYTNNSGFRVELDYSKFPINFVGPIPVNYCPKYDGVEFDSLNPLDWVSHIIWSSYKKDIWSYENEFRYLIFKTGDKFFELRGILAEHNTYPSKKRYESYNHDCVKSVTLGYNFLRNEKLETETLSDGRKKATATFDTNDNSKLKFQLLEHIFTKKIPCYMTNVNKFELMDQPMELIKEREFTYSIIV